MPPTRANLAIYVISALGVASRSSAEATVPGMPTTRNGKVDFTPLGSTARSGGLNQFDWLQTMGTDPSGDLDVLARATGGFLVKDTNDFGRELDRIEDDAGAFYTLVYYPSNRNYNGAFRKIKVELAERGYQVRYRQGYWALPPGREVIMTPAAAQLLSAVESGERKPRFVPQVNAALVAAPSGRFSVAAAVSMPGKLVRFERSGEQFVAGVNLLLVARDAHGELLAVHERYGDLKLDQAASEEFASKVFNMQGHLPVPDLQPVTVQAIVRLGDDTAASAGGRAFSRLRRWPRCTLPTWCYPTTWLPPCAVRIRSTRSACRIAGSRCRRRPASPRPLSWWSTSACSE